jgi:dTDP-D-glucose 4,6-dehydratase
VKFEDGIKEIIGWYMQNPLWQKINENDNFVIDMILHDYLKLLN